MSTTEALPVAVIGAGAAGLLTALAAARAGARVVLLERTADGGRRILISGRGRCNILPSLAQPERYVTDSSPNALRRMLRSWPLEEQRTFFERELGTGLVLEEESGKLWRAPLARSDRGGCGPTPCRGRTVDGDDRRRSSTRGSRRGARHRCTRTSRGFRWM